LVMFISPFACSLLSNAKTCDSFLPATKPMLLCSLVGAAAALAAPTAADCGLVLCRVLGGVVGQGRT
jgi:hypothetical protein